jgi:ornithine cyclodeaminase/alanine dehydrogenase
MKAGIFRRDQIHAELGEIVVGRKKAREDDLEITVFKSVGLGIQDAAVARLAYVKATKMGIGDKIELL